MTRPSAVATGPAVRWCRSARNTRVSGLVAGAFGAFFLALGVLYPEPSGRIASLAIAAVAGVALVLSIRTLRDTRPLLAIDRAGIMYRPFSTQVVPWSEVTDVAIVRTHRFWARLTRTGFAHQRQLDTVNFAVVDPRRYAPGPGSAISRAVAGAGGAPPIVIQCWFIDASTEEIAAAIGAHWPGEIRRIDRKTR